MILIFYHTYFYLQYELLSSDHDQPTNESAFISELFHLVLYFALLNMTTTHIHTSVFM